MWELTEIEGINFGIYPGDVFYFDMEKIKQNTCVVKKEENGCEDITYTTGEIGDKLKITYVGFEAVGFQKAEMVFFAEPIFDVPLFGARGVRNSSNILDKITRLLLVPGIIYARSIRLEDYLNLINTEGKERDEQLSAVNNDIESIKDLQNKGIEIKTDLEGSLNDTIEQEAL